MKRIPEFPNLYIVDHPLVQHKLSHMRDVTTSTKTFRELLKEIALLMGYEITRDLPIGYMPIETPMCTMEKAPVIEGKKLAVVPILRAGIGMAEGLMELIPSARVGHIGVYRDHKTLKPVEYFKKLPAPLSRHFIVVDPMLATGNSASYAIDILKRAGIEGSHIDFMALVGVREGIKCLLDNHPDVKVYIAGLDEKLNENGYILPGLGDAGDRLFGTKTVLDL